jgi:hypothetical protein
MLAVVLASASALVAVLSASASVFFAGGVRVLLSTTIFLPLMKYLGLPIFLPLMKYLGLRRTVRAVRSGVVVEWLCGAARAGDVVVVVDGAEAEAEADAGAGAGAGNIHPIMLMVRVRKVAVYVLD